MRLIDADELINQCYEIVVDGLQYDTCNKSIDIMIKVNEIRILYRKERLWKKDGI